MQSDGSGAPEVVAGDRPVGAQAGVSVDGSPVAPEAGMAGAGEAEDLSPATGLPPELARAQSAAARRIAAGARAARRRLDGAAAEVGSAVDAALDDHLRAVRSAVDAKRKWLDTAVEAAQLRAQLRLLLRTLQVSEAGARARTDLRNSFAKHRAAVGKTVSDGIAGGEEIRARQAGIVDFRVRAAAGKAESLGHAETAAFPKTARGQAQSDAAWKVVTVTADEILKRGPEAKQAVGELLESLPARLTEAGDETLRGLDEALPGLLGGIDEQVSLAQEDLRGNGPDIRTRMRSFAVRAHAQLDRIETAAVGHVEGLRRSAHAGIDAGLATARRSIAGGATAATARIREVVEDAADAVRDAQGPDLGDAASLVAQVGEFAAGAADDAAGLLMQGAGEMAGTLRRAVGVTTRNIGSSGGVLGERLGLMEKTVAAGLADTVSRLDANFAGHVTRLDEMFRASRAQIDATLTEAVGKLAAGFRQTLRDAEAQIVLAIRDGLAKNDEALGQLPAAMRAAAAQAAWDYDHPYLAWLRDTGKLVAGVVAGIVVVLVLVVVAIVAFKALVAGLIALGVSAAWAAAIAVVVGVGVLAAGLYLAYRSRRAAGEGAWEALGGAVLDFTGITDIRQAFSAEGLTPFQRGYRFGKGIATVATFVFGRRLNTVIGARLSGIRFLNPQRGVALRWLRNRLRRGAPEQRPFRSCFVPGTLVLTPGGPVPIEALRPGDLVRACDVATGRLATQPVLATSSRTVPAVLDIVVAGERITCTPEHPFWMPGEGAWREAGTLRAGDLLRTHEGRDVPVEAAGPRSGTGWRVHNLTVAGLSTYLVSAAGIVVHNKAASGDPRLDAARMVADLELASMRARLAEAEQRAGQLPEGEREAALNRLRDLGKQMEDLQDNVSAADSPETISGLDEWRTDLARQLDEVAAGLPAKAEPPPPKTEPAPEEPPAPKKSRPKKPSLSDVNPLDQKDWHTIDENWNAGPHKVAKSGLSGKEAATDIPDWATGARPRVGENGKQFADRLMGYRYPGFPKKYYDKGSESEWSQLQKYVRGYEDPG